MKKGLIYLLLIVIGAAILRFYSIATNPPALTWDEVAWGYNAYSLGTDGKDEFGNFLPYKYLESFGDFKPPMYAYLDIVPVKVFGLTEFATRFPSAFFGTLTVFLTYFLVLQIFFRSKKKEIYALSASFFLAISPWHINLSRAAFEANVASFFLILGITAFLYAINRKPWFLLISAASFIASLYTFNTSRVVAPLLVIVLGAFFFKKLWIIKKQTIASIILGVLLLIPIVGFLLSPQAGLRYKEVNIFTNPDVVKTANQEIVNDNGAAWSKVIHNRRLIYSVSFVQHYLDNLNPRFLFIRGDGNPKFSTQDVGQLYLWSLPFLLVGSFLIFRKREGYWYIVPLWIFIGIIPAATARETPHALRIETTLPAFQILEAYGFVAVIVWFMNKIKEKTLTSTVFKLLAISYLLLAIFNISYYLYGYYVHYAREYSGEWQYGYKDSIGYVKENTKNYDEIQVTSLLGRPYAYYLFYLQTDPSEFRRDAIVTRDAFGFVTVQGFGKYRFGDISNKKDSKGKKILYIQSAQDAPKEATILKTIKRLDGTEVLKIYTL